jgi:hypothetical protein
VLYSALLQLFNHSRAALAGRLPASAHPDLNMIQGCCLFLKIRSLRSRIGKYVT